MKDNKSKSRLIDDKAGLMEWAANDRAIVKFTTMEEIKAKEIQLKGIIKLWLSAAK